MMDIEISALLRLAAALINAVGVGLLCWRGIKLQKENIELRHLKEFWELYGATTYDIKKGGFVKRYAESDKVVTLDDRRRYGSIPSSNGGGRAA